MFPHCWWTGPGKGSKRGHLLSIFFFGCAGSSLPCAGFLLLQQARATLHCMGFWFGGLLSNQKSTEDRAAEYKLWAHMLSSCDSRALERRLSSCSAGA